ncbi:Serine/threonine protein kinase [Hoyosella subflava DQS3-9A1]|uniref:Serine/threonine protein kinase n=1 Tax=Hoyosella subflava (strain DSM 45089 / JCM 17490 / NBRC 109087 / DQS3-9A1) TaxID=443218 RepID=F6EQE6_HOYSD|nr:Serine/threonine protein kinase [Hoyosella subflava DQS3-9A1]
MPQDLEGTQRDFQFGIAAELGAAGFDDAREIGRGGFGIVYRCIETALNRQVAVKVLRSEVARRGHWLQFQPVIETLADTQGLNSVTRSFLLQVLAQFEVVPAGRSMG